MIGKVLSQSGSYWWAPEGSEPEPLTARIAGTSRLPIELFMEVGVMELPAQLDTNRRLHDVLRSKGYPVDYREFNGNHSYLNWRGTVAAGMIALLAPVTPTAAQGVRAAADLVTHSMVTIDRPAARIWPLVVEPNQWKQGAKLWHVGGPVGAAGEVFAAGDPANRSAVAFYLENVELVPNRRRTVKLYLADGTLLGYATWWLEEAGGRTRVGYDVYSETLRPAPDPADEGARRAEREAVAANQRRFDAELVELKRLAESGGR